MFRPSTRPLFLSAWLTSRALCCGRRKSDRPSLAVYVINGMLCGGVAGLAVMTALKFVEWLMPSIFAVSSLSTLHNCFVSLYV